MDSGKLVITTSSGDVREYDANTHTYEVWASEKKRHRKVEVTKHTPGVNWIVASIDDPLSIEWRFPPLVPNANDCKVRESDG